MNRTTPPTDPSPVPGTLAAMTFGPPNFSLPLVMLSACSRCTYVFVVPDTSFVLATTYKVLVARSMTGEPVIPISGEMSRGSPVSAGGTGVTPLAGPVELAFHNGDTCDPSASNA